MTDVPPPTHRVDHPLRGGGLKVNWLFKPTVGSGLGSPQPVLIGLPLCGSGSVLMDCARHRFLNPLVGDVSGEERGGGRWLIVIRVDIDWLPRTPCSHLF